MKKGLIAAIMILISLSHAACNHNVDRDNGKGVEPAADQSQPQATDENSTGNAGAGFVGGHMLNGRYVNTNYGIKSYTFYTNGTFKNGAASSGEFHGGDYVAGQTGDGTYYLNGFELILSYPDGKSETLPIEIAGFNVSADSYQKETPTQIRINNVTYTNVDE